MSVMSQLRSAAAAIKSRTTRKASSLRGAVQSSGIKAASELTAVSTRAVSAIQQCSTNALEGELQQDYFGDTPLGVSHKWIDKEDQWHAKKFGDDQNNVKLGSAGYSLSSGYSGGDGEHSIDLIKMKAHAEAVSVQGGKDWTYGEIEGKLKVLSAEAEASIGAEWSKDAKDIHAKVGGSVDLIKGEVGGKFKIPFFGRQIIVGLGLEGQVGAAAEAKGYAGWNEEDGFGVGGKLKVGAGLGGGVNFSLGFK
jgi:hypothetical protein